MTNNIPIELISGHLKGTNTASEERFFETWLADGNNRSVYGEAVRLWEEVRGYGEEFDQQTAWSRISGIVEEGQAERRLKRRRCILRYAGSIAAGIASAAVILFTYRVVSLTNRQDMASYENVSGKSKIELPDGSEAVLNANSSLSYDRKFNVRERRLIADGRVFFSVAKDAGKPFYVEADGLTIKVTGTRFGVDTRSENVVVSLVSGSVELSSDSEGQVSMSPGDVATYNKSDGSIKVASGEVDGTVLWCADRLSFSDATLGEVCDDLSKWFDIKVNVEEELREKGRITFTITDEPLEAVLFIISKTTSVKYRYDGLKNVIIYR